jgi:Uri superfamily endonuclease
MSLGAICASEIGGMRGTYTIVLACERPMRIRFGKLGRVRVKVGYYLYTGSALGVGAVSLEGRLDRHNRSMKKKRWHIDYLTARRGCNLKGAVYLISNKRFECKINRAIERNMKTEVILQHLGASDCSCEAHLVRVTETLSKIKLLNRLKQTYSRFGVARLCGGEGI